MSDIATSPPPRWKIAARRLRGLAYFVPGRALADDPRHAALAADLETLLLGQGVRLPAALQALTQRLDEQARRQDERHAATDAALGAAQARVQALEAQGAALAASVDALMTRLVAADNEANALRNEVAALNARLVFFNRCLGLDEAGADPATQDDPAKDGAVHEFVAASLAHLEARMLAYLEGPYLQRAAAAKPAEA